MNASSRLLSLLMLVAVLTAGQAYAQQNDEILDRLRERYESTDALRARFTQTIGAESMDGRLALRGDAYRIVIYQDGEPVQIAGSDGTTMWAYTEEDNTVTLNDVPEDDDSFSATEFFTRYPDRFDIRVAGRESMGGKPVDKLVLTPTSTDLPIREVTLFVRSSDALPMRVQVIDGNGTPFAFDLYDIEINPRLGPDAFAPPEGADVIDLRL